MLWYMCSTLNTGRLSASRLAHRHGMVMVRVMATFQGYG